MNHDPENRVPVAFVEALSQFLGPKALSLFADELSGRSEREEGSLVVFPSTTHALPETVQEYLSLIEDHNLRRFARGVVADVARIEAISSKTS